MAAAMVKKSDMNRLFITESSVNAAFWTILHLLQMQIYDFFLCPAYLCKVTFSSNHKISEATEHIVIVVICFGVR